MPEASGISAPLDLSAAPRSCGFLCFPASPIAALGGRGSPALPRSILFNWFANCLIESAPASPSCEALARRGAPASSRTCRSACSPALPRGLHRRGNPTSSRVHLRRSAPASATSGDVPESEDPWFDSNAEGCRRRRLKREPGVNKTRTKLQLGPWDDLNLPQAPREDGYAGSRERWGEPSLERSSALTPRSIQAEAEARRGADGGAKAEAGIPPRRAGPQQRSFSESSDEDADTSASDGDEVLSSIPWIAPLVLLAGALVFSSPLIVLAIVVLVALVPQLRAALVPPLKDLLVALQCLAEMPALPGDTAVKRPKMDMR